MSEQAKCPTCGRRPSERVWTCGHCVVLPVTYTAFHECPNGCEGTRLSCPDPIHDLADRCADHARALREVEWSAREWCGAGAPMHMQEPQYGCGTWDLCCPVCRGIKPGSSNGWTKSAYGHKPGCKLDAALSPRGGGD